MLRFVIFCHVWFLIPDVIDGVENSTDLQAKSFRFLASLSPSEVIRVSVLEGHHVCLPCGGFAGSNVIWTHQNQRILVTRQSSYQTNHDRQHYVLLGDGGLCMLKLEDSDSGEYECNQRLVAELQVLTGHDFTVSTGRTLLLPCRGSSKSKHKWFRQREGQKEEVIFTRFRNGTGKAEKDASRLSYINNALQITKLQPGDAGEYLCNRVLQAKLTVLEEHPVPDSIPSSTTIRTISAVSVVFETQSSPKKRPENALLLVAVIGLGLMIVLIALVCIFLTSMKCRKRRRHRYAAKRREETELQLWMTYNAQTEYEVFKRPSLQDDTIHYASLGRQSWSQRPSWSPPDQSSSNVVYSSVITRPAAKHTFS
ncbi:PREDICTED: uncharacterized protein LOC106929979 [Poecilia mexicana]|uniref:uncharacterized protein LOC106929979 n=1 Tax=Poecilia mexicana TaxID=48701 RepID=UPI00072D9DE0|nr:PREDICTED: uncharacterized protein LOC106929979 [Poecilia mexicana]